MPSPGPLLSEDQFRSALSRYDISLADEHVAPLCRYCELLWEWNQQLNLTRHTDVDHFVARDLIDSLRLSDQIAADQTILDVGSGGGVPGIILAIIRPDLNIALAESVGKKARVLTDITGRMDLGLPIHAARGEDVLRQQRFNVLTVRAVAPLRKLLFWFQRQAAAFDQMLLVKGPRWVAERDEAESEGLLQHASLEVLDEYTTPGHDHKSVILSLKYPQIRS